MYPFQLGGALDDRLECVEVLRDRSTYVVPLDSSSAARPIRARSTGSCAAWMHLWASASTSPTGKRRPVSPWSTTSLADAMSLAINTRAHAWASKYTRARPSPKEGNTTISARLIHFGMCS